MPKKQDSSSKAAKEPLSLSLHIADAAIHSPFNDTIPAEKTNSLPISPPVPALAAATNIKVLYEAMSLTTSPPIRTAATADVTLNADGPLDSSNADEMPSFEEEKEDNRPLAVRFLDKNWRVRTKAYSDIKALVEVQDGTNDFIFSELCPIISSAASDSSPAALDMGLSMLQAFVDAAPGSVRVEQCTEKIAAAVIDKTFSARRELQSKGQSVLLKLMEVSEAETLVTLLLSRLADKKPKIPPTCLETVTMALKAFGTQALPSKLPAIINALPPVLDSSNGALREQAMALLIETARWVGSQPLQVAVLDKLRSSQKSDFEQLLSKISTEPAIPTVWLRKMRLSSGASNAATAAVPTGISKPTFTAHDLAAELDLCASLKGTEFHNLVKQEKWSDQLQGIQLALDLLGPSPKLVAGCDVSAVVSACKVFLRQGTHVAVQLSTLRLLGLLSDGMRAEFGSHARPMLQSIVAKCREKKLVSEMQSILTTMIRYCLTFEPLCDDVCEHISNKKVPSSGRIALVEMVQNVLSGMPDRLNDASLRAVATSLIGSCEDADSGVREACTSALSTLFAVAQARGKPCDTIVKTVMTLESTNIKLFKRLTSAPSSQHNSVSASTNSALQSQLDTAPTIPASPKPASPVKTSQKTKKGSPNKELNATENIADTDENKDDMDLDSATTALAALQVEGWSDAIQALMDSPKWNERVDAFTAMTAQLNNTNMGGKLSRPLVAYISLKTSGLKISNVNVTKAALTLFVAAAVHVGEEPWHRPAAARLLSAFSDRLADKKLGEEAQRLFTALCEAVSPSFVVGRLIRILEASKAPAPQQAFFEWASTLITEFGAAALPVQAIAKLCETGMSNKLPAVRAAAVTLLGAFYHVMGPRVQGMLGKLEPSQQALIEAEFAKVGYDASSAKAPTRAARSESTADVSIQIPRQDLLSLLAKSIPTDLVLTEGKTSWQNRKAALEAVLAACTSSGYFLDYTKATGELLRNLKTRLNDTQANLKPLAAQAIGALIASLEPKSAARALTTVGSALLACFSDSKKPMRDAALAALNAAITLRVDSGTNGVAAESAMLTAILPNISEALTNPVGRLEVLGWLQPHASHLKADVGDLAIPLVSALQDKQAPVRAIAEALLAQFASQGCLSSAAFERATRDLSAATKRSFQSSLDHVKTALAPIAGEEAQGPRLGAAERLPKAPEVQAPSLGAPQRAAKLPSSRIPPPASAAASLKTTALTTVPFREDRPEPTSAMESVAAASSDNTEPLRKTNKASRLEDRKLHWPPSTEDVGESELVALQAQWEPLLSPSSLRDTLFPAARDRASVLYNQDSLQPALEELTAASQHAHFHHHLDFVLRWLTYALCVRETAAGLLHVLRVIKEIMQSLSAQKLTLHDNEAAVLLPHLVERSGHKSDKHRAAFKATIDAMRIVTSIKALQQHMLPALSCKNKRSRVVCIEALSSMVSEHGYTALGRAGWKDVGALLDDRENDIIGRNACLDLCMQLYEVLGGDFGKLIKLLGEPTDRARSLLEAKCKASGKDRPTKELTHINSEHISPVKASEATVARKSSPILGKPARKVKSAAPKAESTVVNAGSNLPVVDSPFRLEMTPPEETKQRKRFDTSIDTSVMDAKLNELSAVMNSLSMSMTPGKPMSPRGKAAATMKLNLGKSQVMFTEGPPAAVTASVTASDKKFNSATSPTSKSPEKSDRDCKGGAKKKGRNSIGNSPQATATNQSDNSSKAEVLFGIFAEISSKMDALLYGPSNERTHNDATDYIKILHSIASGAWSVEVSASDDQDLQMHAQALFKRLARCVDRAFSAKDYSAPPLSPGASLHIDVSLASAALATIFALLKRPGILKSVSSEVCADVLRVSLIHLVDPRIAPTMRQVNTADTETAEQIVRALNIIALKLAADMQPVSVMIVLLRLVGDAAIGLAPSQTAKPVTKLLVRVLAEEMRTTTPFQGLAVTQEVAALLHGLRTLLSQLDTRPAHEAAFSCSKTVMTELVKSLSAKRVLLALQAQGATAADAVVKLVAKIGGLSVDASPELEARITTLADEIARVQDKQTPIQELFQLQQEHPETDVLRYMSHLSAAHKRFIADRLNTLQAERNAHPDIVNENSASNATIKGRLSTDSADSLQIGSASKKKKKRLSGGKGRLSHSGGDSAGGADDAVVALQTRKAHLDNMPSPPAAVSEKAINIMPPPAPVACPPAPAIIATSSSGGVDSDLMARLARLKGMTHKTA